MTSLLNQPFTVLDTETTGVEDTDEVIEVGLLHFTVAELLQSRNPDKFSHWEQLFQPHQSASPESMSVHHILPQDLEGKPRLQDCLPLLESQVGSDPIIGYNTELDWRLLPSLQDKVWLDAERMALAMWNLGQNNAQGHPLSGFSLQRIRYWLGIYAPTWQVETVPHRALADAIVTAALWSLGVNQWLEWGHPDDYEAFLGWLRTPIAYKVIPFGPHDMMGVPLHNLSDNQLERALLHPGPWVEAWERRDVMTAFAEEARQRISNGTLEGKVAKRLRNCLWE